MHRLYKARARRARKSARITRADAEAFQMKCAQRDEKGENKESGCRCYANQGPSKGRKRARTTRAGAEATQIKGPQREEKGENKARGCRGFSNQMHAEGGEG